MKNIIIKFSFLALAVAVMTIGATKAQLFDSELSVQNTFEAGSLMVDLESDQESFDSNSLNRGESTSRDFRVVKLGSLDMEYGFEAGILDGSNNDFCQALDVKVKKDLVTVYEGKLLDLSTANLLSGATGSFEDFSFDVILPEDANPLLQNMTCNFYIQVEAWNEGGSKNTGFNHQDSINNLVSSIDWAPQVTIHNLTDGQSVSEEVAIDASILDINLSHYWFVIQNKTTGAKVAGPGTVTQHTSLDHHELMIWNTNDFEDGEYVIKLEARDLAGNKVPNLSPVLTDPENQYDSVDWVELTVNNEEEVLFSFSSFFSLDTLLEPLEIKEESEEELEETEEIEETMVEEEPAVEEPIEEETTE